MFVYLKDHAIIHHYLPHSFNNSLRTHDNKLSHKAGVQRSVVISQILLQIRLVFVLSRPLHISLEMDLCFIPPLNSRDDNFPVVREMAWWWPMIQEIPVADQFA